MLLNFVKLGGLKLSGKAINWMQFFVGIFWEFWYHHDINKESSELYRWAKSKSQVYRDSAGRKSC